MLSLKSIDQELRDIYTLIACAFVILCRDVYAIVCVPVQRCSVQFGYHCAHTKIVPGNNCMVELGKNFATAFYHFLVCFLVTVSVTFRRNYTCK